MSIMEYHWKNWQNFYNNVQIIMESRKDSKGGIAEHPGISLEELKEFL